MTFLFFCVHSKEQLRLFLFCCCTCTTPFSKIEPMHQNDNAVYRHFKNVVLRTLRRVSFGRIAQGQPQRGRASPEACTALHAHATLIGRCESACRNECAFWLLSGPAAGWGRTPRAVRGTTDPTDRCRPRRGAPPSSCGSGEENSQASSSYWRGGA